MRGVVVGGMLAATVLAGGGAAEAQAADGDQATYVAQATMLTGMVVETIGDMGTLSEALLEDMGNGELVRDIVAETGVLEAVYEAARDLEPPATLDEAHDEMLAGLELIAEAAPLLREGYDEMDSLAMGEATDLITEAQGHLEAALGLIEEAGV